MKIVYCYHEEWEKAYMQEKMPDHEFVFIHGSLQDNSDVSDQEATVLSVFVKSKVGKEELNRFPKVEFIATRSTGFDHIDFAEVEARGITVSNVPTYGENTVAEFAFALLLTLSRKTYDAYDQIRETGSFSQKGLTGFDLKDKTLGVVGYGHIGSYMVEMGKGFGMDVKVFDIRRDEEEALKRGFEYVEFDDLLSRADVISIHVPYNEHTHHMISSESLSKLKKGVHIINTARGAVIETAALVKGLQDGIIAGAGLDVLEEEADMQNPDKVFEDMHPDPERLETLLSNQYLIDHPRVIITPHNAFNTTEAIERILNTTAENIIGFARGNPRNVVEPK